MDDKPSSSLFTSPDTLEAPSTAPASTRTPLTAYLKVNPPPAGQSRNNWYLYDVVLEGETIVSNSKDPECEAARVLLSRGITGKMTMADAITKRPRTIIDIAKAAKVTVQENNSVGPRFVKWRPNPWKSGELR